MADFVEIVLESFPRRSKGVPEAKSQAEEDPTEEVERGQRALGRAKR